MTNEYLAKRYGKNPSKDRNQRVLWTVVGAVLLVAFLVWALIINFAAPSSISANIKNFDLKSPIQTTATVTVTNPSLRDGICAIRVLNKSFAIVGYRELPVAGSLGAVADVETSINTTELGVSATVDRCWFK